MAGKSKKLGNKFNPQEAGKLIYKVLNGCKRIPTEDYGRLVNTVLSAQDVRNNITKEYITFENMESYIIILQVVNFKLGNIRYQLQVETSLEDTFISLFNLTRGMVANKNVYCNGMVYD